MASGLRLWAIPLVWLFWTSSTEFVFASTANVNGAIDRGVSSSITMDSHTIIPTESNTKCIDTSGSSIGACAAKNVLEGPGSSFGVVQRIEHDNFSTQDFLESLEETEAYLKQNFPTDFYSKARPWCYNFYENCTLWALQGEYEEDPLYMKTYCAPAILHCEVEEGPGSDFGVVQILEDEEVKDPLTALRKLEETEIYINDVIWSAEFYVKVRSLCWNKDKMCTIWAAQGYCEDEDQEERDFMYADCPAACQVCDQLHYETRCPLDPVTNPNVFKPGDLDRMFERILADPQYNATVMSRPDYVNGDTEETANYHLGPWIVMLEDFIRPEEAERLKQWGHDLGFEPSWLMGETDEETGEVLEGTIDKEDRTSLNTWCTADCEGDPLVAQVYGRIQNLTGCPSENYESFQLLKYEVGEFYTLHSDNSGDNAYSMAGPRILTVFLYLNDVEEGGETRFEHFDITVKPKLGRAVVWPSTLNENPELYDSRTWHQSLPVLGNGRKYGANVWIHLRSVVLAEEKHCFS